MECVKSKQKSVLVKPLEKSQVDTANWKLVDVTEFVVIWNTFNKALPAPDTPNTSWH